MSSTGSNLCGKLCSPEKRKRPRCSRSDKKQLSMVTRILKSIELKHDIDVIKKDIGTVVSRLYKSADRHLTSDAIANALKDPVRHTGFEQRSANGEDTTVTLIGHR
ncbi:hypothetical protein RvY_03151 [Ramazzottius varieornatus]|uniref:Uncharacterized protein n=1 Tax=Ramazzottius varieornatus TaxID=947166 RepID=A0A1D1UU41_RAMVA|nr:hypothetical protein RvY_03151 [Ramazzottius varieornatus]